MRLTTKVIVASLALFLGANSLSAQSSLEGSEIKLFPNPSNEGQPTYMSMQNIASESILVVVYDMLGRELFSKVELKENDGYLFTINNGGSALSKGVYLIVASSNDKYYSEKLIVR